MIQCHLHADDHLANFARIYAVKRALPTQNANKKKKQTALSKLYVCYYDTTVYCARATARINIGSNRRGFFLFQDISCRMRRSALSNGRTFEQLNS